MARLVPARRRWLRPCTTSAVAARGPSSRSIAQPFPPASWKASSSAMRRARSPAPPLKRMGRFELAHGGTIFLDEVGEISLELQPKLLRVLQEREFERLGGTRTLHSDTRVVAATNRDLKTMVDRGTFRSDLFYRLNVFPIHVPALRDRPEDIRLLVRHFANELSKRMNKSIRSIPCSTMSALCQYPWPGNIRELQNVVE